jgi:hypothetical protein
MPRLPLKSSAVLVVVFLLVGLSCLQERSWEARAETASETGAALVECILPGRIRPLGSTPYVTPGRTIKTTKKECETRGGRLVAPTEPGTEIPSGEPVDQF